jgi:hypothetical protein
MRHAESGAGVGQSSLRGAFTSVADLTAAIEAYIDGWNEHAAPFTWTKTADQLIEKITAAKTKTAAIQTTRGNCMAVLGQSEAVGDFSLVRDARGPCRGALRSSRATSCARASVRSSATG